MKPIEFLYEIFQQHSRVIIDSRKIEEGCLFFALKGDRFNGNEYAKDAIQKGAAFAIIDEARYNIGDNYILVEDVLQTLQNLANFHRKKMEIPVIGITGSNGKTTTKELLAAVLDQQYNCHFTKGNFNNHIGVPLTLLELKHSAQIAVIEMGANHVGEIDFLCKIAEPTHGIITNIGKAHLEGFGGIEGIKKGKSELYKYLANHDGVAFVNLDENYLTDLSDTVKKRVLYKKSKHPNPLEPAYETILYTSQPFIKVGFLDQNQKIIELQSQLIGDYNFNNIMTAISIGRYFRVPIQGVIDAIENYIPSNNRSQLVKKNRNTFILDAYNANPTSMANALKNFEKLQAVSKMVILGDMLELGKYSQNEHQNILNQAKEMQLENIILVGEEFRKLEITSNKVRIFESVVTLKEWFDQQKIEDSHILIKGSRGIKLERLLLD